MTGAPSSGRAHADGRRPLLPVPLPGRDRHRALLRGRRLERQSVQVLEQRVHGPHVPHARQPPRPAPLLHGHRGEPRVGGHKVEVDGAAEGLLDREAVG
jgi:hypothetical protein